MLQVKNLTKIYKRGKRKTTAVNNISFTFDDKGFVFIVGKSGSGKSTLLNLLGGLDNVTQGVIIADGNDLSKFKKSEYDNYRNSYIGFIFQEFYLLEQLTLEQNVGISLDLKNTKNKEAVYSAIEKVGLKGLENRYMNELSGGQKQRVAIARSLVKKPHIILADEPTGNLDSKSAKQILDLLKEISKENLVVIVSHNMESANTYADRIIELADGQIIRDEQRVDSYINELKIENNTLTLPYCKELDDEELSQINASLKKGQIKQIKQLGSGFEQSENHNKSEQKLELEKANMNFKSSLSLSLKFFNRRKLAAMFTVLINTLLIFILGLCQFFILYDTKESINTVMTNTQEQEVILYKGKYYNEDKKIVTANVPVRAATSDYEEFKSSNYPGNVYPLYNFSITISSTQLEHEKSLNNQNNLQGFYLKETYGTLVTDEQYLIKLFGKDGKLNVLAGNLTDKPYGLIITDYIADSIMNTFPQKYASYEDLLGSYIPYTASRNYINAIIDSGYKERYGDYIEKYISEYKEIQRGERIWMSDMDKVKELWSYIQKYIGVAYSLNPNFGEVVGLKESRDFASLNYITLTYENGKTTYLTDSDAYIDSRLNYDLTGNETILGLTLYNKLFGTNYTTKDAPEEIEPSTIKINKYVELNDLKNNKEPIANMEFKVIGISTDSVGISDFFISDENFKKVKSLETFVYAYYFDDITSIGYVYDIANKNLYVNQSSLYNSVGTVGNIVLIFEDFITLITLFLCFICILLLVNFSFGNIRKHKYEIGVILALGGNNKTITKIFLSQIFLVGILISILSGLALILLTQPIDTMIINKMLEFIKDPAISSLTIINLNIPILVIDIGIVLIVTLISAIIPTLYLRNIKPINIIKSSD